MISIGFYTFFEKKFNKVRSNHYIGGPNVMITPHKIEFFPKKNLKTNGNHSLEKLNFNISYIKPSFILPNVYKPMLFHYLKVRVRIET